MLSEGRFFSRQLLNIEAMLRQTDCTDNAGDQSSVRIERHICPFEYTWGWTGILLPMNVTSGESNGYLLLNLNNNWKCSPSYRVPSKPPILIFHLKRSHNNCKSIKIKKKKEKQVRYETYSDKFCAMLSVSIETPGGGSFISDISSFCSLRCKIHESISRYICQVFRKA